MKVKILDETGNRLMLSGEIDLSYIVRPGVTIVFDKDATIMGVSIVGQTVSNDEFITKNLVLNGSKIISLQNAPLLQLEELQLVGEVPQNEHTKEGCCVIL